MGTGWLEIGNRVWTRRYDFADETVGVIGGSAGLVVVDTRATEVDADKLIRDIEHVSRDPVIAVVNTHGHWDHAFGNARFSLVPIWGHARCPAFMAATAEPMRERLLSMDLTRSQAEALRSVQVTPPTHLVETEETLSLGDRVVRLAHVGRGHTDSDLVIEVPDCGVAFVGDLVKQGGPPGYRDAFPVAWASTMERLLHLVDGPVVPGHGTVVDRAFVEDFAARIGAVAQLVSAIEHGELDRDQASQQSPIHPPAFQEASSRAHVELAVQRPHDPGLD
jgi:glyoxylase-like metal-dependent hydrolase (beta-lactamase superfamily II)